MENIDKDRLLDRIKKMLALAGNNPNAEEAATAAAMAMRLMRKYNLETTDLQAHELHKDGAIIRAVVENAPNYKVRVAKWFNVLVTGVGDALSCTAAIGYGPMGGLAMYLHGARQDVEVANWLVTYLHVQIDKLADARWKEKDALIRIEHGRAPYASERTREKNNYRFGLACRVLGKVREVYSKDNDETAEETNRAGALVVLKRQLVQQQFPGVLPPTPTEYRDSVALRLGYRDGEKINVQRVMHDDVQKPAAFIN